ncbi:hypothetical protein ACIQAA_27145 [Neobacillus sp. NPDC093182]|uniref:hypothetical protein n=1 Tax=Neobacillus sp. NPDC093182 TaxID=3364297 RepID=UPI00382FC47B
MIQIIKNKDEKKFLKELEEALKKNPNVEVHYSVGQSSSLGSANLLTYTALLISK